MPRCPNRYCCHKLPKPARFCPRCGTRRRPGGRRWLLLGPLIFFGAVVVSGLNVRHARSVAVPALQTRQADLIDTRTYPDYGHGRTTPSRYPEHQDWSVDRQR